MLVSRNFNHYGMWYHFFGNLDKFYPLVNGQHRAFRQFIYEVILPKKVPDEYFTDETERCSGSDNIECVVQERPSRYKRIIEKALEDRGERQAHYVVLKALVESMKTNFVCCELPVWLPDGKRVGHIDGIEFAEGNPSIFVWDYKPFCSNGNEDASGQLTMYKLILAQLLKIPLEEIGCGWFDNAMEVIVVP